MNKLLLGLAILPTLLLGCASGPYARQGAAIGAIVGTPIGAVIGSRNGETGAGALLGGTIGALAGSNIGADVDAERQAYHAAQLSRPAGLSLPEVMNMHQHGLGEEVIITQIQSQGINRRPNSNDLLALKSAGVSDRVIQAMQTSGLPAGPRVSHYNSPPVIVEEHYWGAPYPRCYPRHVRRPYRPRSGSSFSFSHRF